jgi:hypothetical protein
MRRQDELATAFPEGIPTTPQGYPDYTEMANRMMKIGGVQAAGPLISQMFQLQIGQGTGEDIARTLGGGGAPAPSSGYPARSPNAGPANLSAPGRGPPQPGYDSQGDNIREMVTSAGITGPAGENIIRAAANAAFPGDPNGADRTLTGDQSTKISQFLTQYKERQQAGPNGQGQPGGQPVQTGGQPAAQPGPQVPQQPSGAIGAQPGPGPSPAGPVVPPQAPGSVTGPVTGPQSTGFAPGAPTTPTIPPQFRQEVGPQLEAQRNYFLGKAGLAGGLGNKEVAERYQKAADAVGKQLEQWRDFWKDRAKLTPEQQNAYSSGAASPREFDLAKHADTQRFNAGQKTYLALRQAESDATTNQHYIDIGRAAIQDPNYGGGIGSNLAQIIQRIRARVGSDPNANLANEVLTKTTSASILNQVSQFKDNMAEMGAQSGRIFQSQIDLMLKSSASLEGTPSGSLALLEIQERAGNYQRHIAQMARDYLAGQKRSGVTTPYLDEGFDQKVANYLQKNPMFSKDDLSDIRRLGARTFQTPKQAFDALGAGVPYYGPKRNQIYYSRQQ